MTRLYLIRHAEAEGNLYRIAQGQYNSILTDRGLRQVQALARRFADIPVDAVYASDLYRTCATASAIYRPKNLPLHRRRDLREICVGAWEQRTWGDIARTDPEQLTNFNLHPERWQVEGAETPRQVQDRVLRAVREIARENQGRTVAVVSHGYAIRLVLAELQGCALERLAQTPVGDNTAVSLLETDGENLRVVFRDDNSHLRDPAYLAGETVHKRANGLEPGLYFQSLRLPEQEVFLTDCVSEAWMEAMGERPFQQERLLADAAERNTLVGYLAEQPVALLQLGPELGQMALTCVRPEFRNRGFGVQLIGQAVQQTRNHGGERLRIALKADSAARAFFAGHGFAAVERTGDGRELLEKDIRYDPEFLGEEI